MVRTLFPSSEQPGRWRGVQASEGAQWDTRSVTDRLIAEFGDQIDRDRIVRVVREEVVHLDRAGVRESVAIITWRLARQRLTEDLARAREEAAPDLETG
jgi:hypothetical protein